jgi:hypothetical protein
MARAGVIHGQQDVTRMDRECFTAQGCKLGPSHSNELPVGDSEPRFPVISSEAAIVNAPLIRRVGSSFYLDEHDWAYHFP